MGRVLTDTLSLAYNIEGTLGTVPSTETAYVLEPNELNSYGAVITRVARNPITADRQQRKGATTDLDSGAELGADLTYRHFIDFIEAFLFATQTGETPRQAGADFANLVGEATVTIGALGPGYIFDALTTAIPAQSLIFARGFDTAANNGLDEVLASSTTEIETVSTNQVDETAAQTTGATLEIAGIRFGTSEVGIVVTGDTAVLTKTGGPDFDNAAYDLKPGQWVNVGNGVGRNFSAGQGRARIAAGGVGTTTLNLDKVTGSGLATDPGTGETVDILFGRYVRNVTRTDPSFLERSFSFELGMPNLGAGGATSYYVSRGNLGNQVQLVLPLADKAAWNPGFVGLDTDNPTTTQLAGFMNPIRVNSQTAFNTSSDIAQLRILEGTSSLSACFKNLTLTLNNQVTGEKCLGTLGNLFLNQGNILVQTEAELLLTEEAIIAAIRNNSTLTMDLALTNDDGMIVLDLPSMTLGGGGLNLPRGESVRIATTGEAFKDPSFGTSCSASIFPVKPAA